MKKCIKLLILVFALAMPISTWGQCAAIYKKRGDKHEKRKIQGKLSSPLKQQ